MELAIWHEGAQDWGARFMRWGEEVASVSVTGEPYVIGESKLSPEGRVSLPISVREQLHLVVGDRVQFLADPAGGVRVVSAQALVEAMWAYGADLAVEDSAELL